MSTEVHVHHASTTYELTLWISDSGERLQPPCCFSRRLLAADFVGFLTGVWASLGSKGAEQFEKEVPEARKREAYFASLLERPSSGGYGELKKNKILIRFSRPPSREDLSFLVDRARGFQASPDPNVHGMDSETFQYQKLKLTSQATVKLTTTETLYEFGG